MLQTVSPRFALWLLLIITLIFSALYAGNKLQVKTIDTAYAVAAKKILSKANYFKENWVVKKEPKSMLINGQDVQFSADGWPLPLIMGEIDCRYWLVLLNDSDEVFGHTLSEIKGRKVEDGYICAYSYTEQDAIIIKLLNKTLSVSIHLSSKQIN